MATQASIDFEGPFALSFSSLPPFPDVAPKIITRPFCYYDPGRIHGVAIFRMGGTFLRNGMETGYKKKRDRKRYLGFLLGNVGYVRSLSFSNGVGVSLRMTGNGKSGLKIIYGL
ncbi:hypothetical protein NPIL_507631 [Nephila pilipes]|uniref:Uncharacterized protein n=1 Tax=Nephila pilipes TaxID=299642 RepID=A0A8X6NYY0_NEPPI|nr:hypothetical protein NPIL_507631 [Nephila pilipes]